MQVTGRQCLIIHYSRFHQNQKTPSFGIYIYIYNRGFQKFSKIQITNHKLTSLFITGVFLRLIIDP
jgi:hypothetical protein